VLFHRIFDRFAGHHLKVWHYFRYVMEEPGYAPLMMMSEDSVWDESNPWAAVPELVIRGGRPHPADTYFFSGPVWQPVHRDQRAHAPVPVIHYMQSLRHALPDNIRYDLLENRAIRICVSEYVADSLRETGVVRGPVFTIPAAIDVADVRRRFPPRERDTDLLIVATKQPEMGRRAAERLRAPGRTLQLIDELVPHDEFLAGMQRARVTVFFPSRDEGAPLPMLEAMALGTFVVCPDAIGNRAYVVDGRNSFRPDYDEDQILEAAAAALGGYDELGPLLANASETVRDYDLPAERRAFIEILHDAERLWQDS
jgi:glycosyltransferase involved in cell wall biosynthesis